MIIALLRPQLSGWHKGIITEQRARMEKTTRFFRLPKQVQTRAVDIDGVPAEWIECPESNNGILLYLHGGAYALGSINSHRELVARLVVSTGCDALAINYRLAPEHPYPAALEDSLTAYKWLLASGHDPARIFLAGDSAGGGLAIATLLALRDEENPLPAGAVCFSPWLDLTLSGDSVTGNAELDPVLSGSVLMKYAEQYAGSRKIDDPLVSPLFADLRGLPPVYIQVGSREILLDDAASFCQKAQQDGVDATLDVWDGMFHVFQLISLLPQSAEALKAVDEFVRGVLNRKTA
jgi:acetyl esterase/lipase